jgi:hypothetical protein
MRTFSGLHLSNKLGQTSLWRWQMAARHQGCFIHCLILIREAKGVRSGKQEQEWEREWEREAGAGAKNTIFKKIPGVKRFFI